MTTMSQRKEHGGGLETNPAWLAFVAEVKARADIQQIMSSEAGVKFPARSNRSGDKVICPFHAEKSPSCNVRRNVGHYHCFGCGADGDVFKFITEFRRVSFVDSVLINAEMFGIAIPEEFAHLGSGSVRNVSRLPDSSFRIEAEALKTHQFIIPPPEAEVPATGWLKVWSPLQEREIKLNATLIHEYRTVHGELRSLVVRCQKADGTKYFTPLTWADPAHETELPIERAGWIARGYPSGTMRDIYGLEHIAKLIEDAPLNGVLFVEGEKKCDRAREMLAGSGWAVLSPQGGQNAIDSMNWGEFEAALDMINDTMPPRLELDVLAWPDADDMIVRKDGSKNDRRQTFVSGILAGVRRCSSPLDLKPAAVPVPDGKGDGWDIGDAIENDDWSLKDVLEQLQLATPYEEAGVFLEAEDQMALGLISKENNFDIVEDELPIAPAMNPAPQGIEVNELTEDDLVGNDGPQAGGNGVGHNGGGDLLRRNQALDFHCRPLGYDQEFYYFLPRLKGQIVSLSSSGLRPQALLTLAPRAVWLDAFGETRQGGVPKVEWESAYDYLLSSCHQAGVWTTRNEARVGARMDSGRVFFNSGQQLWVEGVGPLSLASMLDDDGFASKYVYTVGADIGAPDTDTPYADGSDEIQELFQIIKNINWRSENSALYALAFLGWLAIAPICGALSWRPMLWLDGPRGSGKSWIIENIAAKVLGSYAFWVKSNSTESGLRNELNATTLPILFDEAEGEESADRTRMDQILKLARHASTPGDSMVLQGTSGGGNKRSFAIQTTILFSSITPQLRHSADKSRFAQLSLAGGLENEEFTEKLVGPCEHLFSAANFRQRFLGRMLLLAGRMEETKEVFVKALTQKSRIERRTADVYGTLLAGAFLFLEGEEAMSDWSEADNWLASHGVKGLITEHGQAVSEDKDHDRMMATLLAYPVMVSSGTGTIRTRVGMLIQIALGGQGSEDSAISQQEAFRVLNEMGIRAETGRKAVAGKMHGAGVFFHKDLQPIRDALKDTAYGSNYEATLRQIDGAVPTGPIGFPGIGSHRTIFIPVDGVLRGFGEHDDDAIGSAKTEFR